MKFTLSWLKEHLDTEASLAEICTTLDRIGLEVEEVTDPAVELADFVIARVEKAEPHPDADRLRVCTVFDGKTRHQVVCGAPNARTGLIGVFAPTGTYIPGTGITLAKAKIRGVESAGMLCSERELELSQEHDGIIDLPAESASEVGKRFVDVAGLGDPMIYIKITPNRPDALGVRGIARDLAAAGLGKLKKENRGWSGKPAFPCPIEIDLRFPADKQNACPAFAGRLIRGVKNAPSPKWLQDRLRAIGLRPINALVDVTNFVSFDRARPLHVYDADKLEGTIHARLGKSGEEFEALDGKRYQVNDEMTVIADDNGVLGLGGVIGGETTGCQLDTVNVFIESAYFDPIRTATTGRLKDVNSDARYRFERGIDPQSLPLGIDLATQLILDICGGKPSEMRMAGTAPDPQASVALDLGLIERLTGLAVKDAEVRKTLKALGFETTGKGPRVDVSVPSWRPDVGGAADLVEEVIRIIGIDKVPSTPMPRMDGVAKPVTTPAQQRLRRTRRELAARGLVEAITWSFITRDTACHFGGGQEELELGNPISSELSNMRPSLLPGLITAVQRNRDRSITDPALFEVGQIYHGDQPDQQFLAAAGVRADMARGSGAGRHWDDKGSPVDLFEAKADAATVLRALGLDAAKLQVTREAPAWYHPGRSGTFKLGPKVTLGHFGELHPATLAALGASAPMVAFEIVLDHAPIAKRRSRAKPALDTADLQPVRRDFAFVTAGDVAAGDLIRAAAGADRQLITDVTLFDIFEGGNIGEGRKSLAIEITLQPRQKTLTDEEIEAVSQKVIAQVKKATGGEIRD